MKNVQIIDGAENCTYSIFAFTEKEFKLVFPNAGQDIEFIEDVVERVGDQQVGDMLAPVWERRIDKKKVRGIHGTLFYGLAYKKKYYPTKRDCEMVVVT